MLKDHPGSDIESPVLLAIDTSTEIAGLALYNGALIAEYIWKAGRSHTTSLMPAISWLLEHNNHVIEDVAAIGVATGPGTFTGLRVGLSVAKGLVLAHDLPLIGIPTLDVAAAPALALGQDVLAVILAGRGRFVWATYRHNGMSSPTPINGTLAEFESTISLNPGLVLAGDWHGQNRRPSVLAQLAWERWQRGETDDAATLQATYVHGRPPGTVASSS